MGISKLHAKIKEERVDWSVSEKRVRRVLGEMGALNGYDVEDGGQKYPKSRLNKSLKINQWTCTYPFLPFFFIDTDYYSESRSQTIQKE